MLTVDQVVASHKANLETLLGLTNRPSKASKIVELNLTASKAAVSEFGDHARAVLSAKDQELLAIQSSLVPAWPKTAAYSRHLARHRHRRFRRTGQVFEDQAGEAPRRSSWAWSTTWPKNAPAGSEAAVAVLKFGGRRQQRARVGPEAVEAGDRGCREQLQDGGCQRRQRDQRHEEALIRSNARALDRCRILESALYTARDNLTY